MTCYDTVMEVMYVTFRRCPIAIRLLLPNFVVRTGDHLTAEVACLTGGQCGVVAALQVDADLGSLICILNWPTYLPFLEALLGCMEF